MALSIYIDNCPFYSVWVPRSLLFTNISHLLASLHGLSDLYVKLLFLFFNYCMLHALSYNKSGANTVYMTSQSFPVYSLNSYPHFLLSVVWYNLSYCCLSTCIGIVLEAFGTLEWDFWFYLSGVWLFSAAAPLFSYVWFLCVHHWLWMFTMFHLMFCSYCLYIPYCTGIGHVFCYLVSEVLFFWYWWLLHMPCSPHYYLTPSFLFIICRNGHCVYCYHYLWLNHISNCAMLY